MPVNAGLMGVCAMSGPRRNGESNVDPGNTLGVHRTAGFRHDRNILAQVWYADRHPDFPQAVWAYLTRAQFGTNPGQSKYAKAWSPRGKLQEASATTPNTHPPTGSRSISERAASTTPTRSRAVGRC